MDERTPEIRNLAFRDIEASNCHVAAAYLYGLPEQKIGQVQMGTDPCYLCGRCPDGTPAMMDGLGEMN